MTASAMPLYFMYPQQREVHEVIMWVEKKGASL